MLKHTKWITVLSLSCSKFCLAPPLRIVALYVMLSQFCVIKTSYTFVSHEKDGWASKENAKFFFFYFYNSRQMDKQILPVLAILKLSYFRKNDSWKWKFYKFLVCGIKKLICDSWITNPAFLLCHYFFLYNVLAVLCCWKPKSINTEICILFFFLFSLFQETYF